MDAGYRLLAAKYLRKQAKQLREQFQGIRDAEDIEFIHRSRVATRRLRAALKVFAPCFKRKRLARWKAAVRRITVELSDARDKDVQIQFLRGMMPRVPELTCLLGLTRLVVHWEYYREALQKKVLKAIQRLQRDGELADLEKKAKRILRRGEKKAVRIQSPYSFLQTEKHITARQEELLAFRDCLDQPENMERHHAMRIALKRLRYTMEISRPLYDKRLDPFLEKVKQVQTFLGDAHDCDVWQEQLDEFAAAERERIAACYGHARPFEQLNAGLEFLKQDRQQRREELFRELVALWRELEEQDFWDRLLEVVKQGPFSPQTAEASSTSATATASPTPPAPKPTGPTPRSDGEEPPEKDPHHPLLEPNALRPARVHSLHRPARREPAVL